MNIANNHLREFFGTTCHHRYMNGILLTDGIVALAEKFRCYWYLDIICSYADVLKDRFQIWTLRKFPDSSALVECRDGNKDILIQQKIAWTDFDADMAIVWKEENVLLLPSEH